MNKKALFAVASLLFLGACTKEDAQELTTTHEVTFNVSTMGVVYEPLTRSASTPAELGSKISEIRYSVLKDGKGFSSGSQTYGANPSTFGTITVTMPSGVSDIHFIGIGEGTGNAYFSSGSSSSTLGVRADNREVFYGSITGHNYNSEVTQSLELRRSSGLITFNITDAANAPSTFAGIDVSYTHYEFMSFTGGVQDPNSRTRSFTGSSSNFPTVEIHSWPITNQKLTFSVKNQSNATVRSYTVTYDVYANKKTVITGELFGGDQPFTVTVLDEWDDDNVVEF